MLKENYNINENENKTPLQCWTEAEVADCSERPKPDKSTVIPLRCKTRPPFRTRVEFYIQVNTDRKVKCLTNTDTQNLDQICH